MGVYWPWAHNGGNQRTYGSMPMRDLLALVARAMAYRCYPCLRGNDRWATCVSHSTDRTLAMLSSVPNSLPQLTKLTH